MPPRIRRNRRKPIREGGSTRWEEGSPRRGSYHTGGEAVRAKFAAARDANPNDHVPQIPGTCVTIPLPGMAPQSSAGRAHTGARPAPQPVRSRQRTASQAAYAAPAGRRTDSRIGRWCATPDAAGARAAVQQSERDVEQLPARDPTPEGSGRAHPPGETDLHNRPARACDGLARLPERSPNGNGDVPRRFLDCSPRAAPVPVLPCSSRRRHRRHRGHSSHAFAGRGTHRLLRRGRIMNTFACPKCGNPLRYCTCHHE
jgi:hypothetical protein